MAKEKKERLLLRDYIKISSWALGLSWKISKGLTILKFITIIYNQLQALVNIYIVARIVDLLISYIGDATATMNDLWPYILILGGVQVLTILINALDSYTRRLMRRYNRVYFDQFLYEKINDLKIQTIQLPDVSNNLQKAKDWIYAATDVNDGVIRLIATFIRMIVTGILIFEFSVILAIGVLVVSLISYIKNRHFFTKSFEWEAGDENMYKRRKAYWSSNMLMNPQNIDEISLYGSYGYLHKGFRSFFDYYLKGFKDILNKDTGYGAIIDIMNVGVLMYGMYEIFKRALEGVLSVGNATFYISAVNNFYGGASEFLSELVFVRDIIMKEKQVFEFFSLEPVIKNGAVKLERFTTPPALELRNVSFKYPETDRYIFKNFNLKINPGDKIALVGENGAGKTTLVKLLCRFYDPNEGEIFVNGINLKNLDLDDWYKNVGVLFQDFNFYGHLTVKENIYMGRSVKDIDEERIIEASKNADAYDFIMKYKDGFDTTMSERFKGGIKPSKGQQQKIAIARFFYRDAPLAIFDEPTASIDADAEYRIFNRIYNFFDNKTVLIISHRFSTVRNADRIIVINDGSVVEEGSHKELLKKKGVYADNFKKQAEGYNN